MDFFENKNVRQLIEFLEPEQAINFFKTFGGKIIYIPELKNLSRLVRDYHILTDYKAGMSYWELSRKYNLSEARIRVIISVWKKFKCEEKVLDWFARLLAHMDMKKNS